MSVSTFLRSQKAFLLALDPLRQISADLNKAKDNKQLLDEVEHDIMNYQNRGLCYLQKPKAEADNTDTRFW